MIGTFVWGGAGGGRRATAVKSRACSKRGFGPSVGHYIVLTGVPWIVYGTLEGELISVG